MAKKTERNLIVGLDIGTSKVAAIVAELASDGSFGSHRDRVNPVPWLKKRRGGQPGIDGAIHPTRY